MKGAAKDLDVRSDNEILEVVELAVLLARDTLALDKAALR